MHFLPENRMCAPPFVTKQRPPHLENPGSATAWAHIQTQYILIAFHVKTKIGTCYNCSCDQLPVDRLICPVVV